MKQLFLGVLVLISFCSKAQQLFTLSLDTAMLTAVPQVHSGVFGAYNGKWFFIGGRKNGLHGFQPPFAFPTSGINDSIFLVDPHTDRQWAAAVYTLPDSIREPITASNMEFYLQDTILYIAGGYGWKDSLQNFVTWPTLTAINVKGLMPAVINGQDIRPFFRQITDNRLAVCGAHLQKIDSVFYLVFGHRFDGTYDRSDTTGFFVQEYTKEIRKFRLADDGVSLAVYNYQAVRDTVNFRRRDFNLIPQIYPWGGIGLVAFSGVFKPEANIPYLTPIEIFDTSYRVRNDFNQMLSQYHSAVCPVYDSVNMLQHNLFFGGISMYYPDSLGNTVSDSLVPFVRTISNVARDVDGVFHEINAGISLPALLGTNASFFLDDSVPLIKEHFVHLNAIEGRKRIGYITGGIESPGLNISDTDPSLSFASPRVFGVYINKQATALPEIKNEVLNFYCYPNPARTYCTVEFELTETKQIILEMLDMQGKVVQQVCNRAYPVGKQKLRLDISSYPNGVYHCVITANNQRRAIRLAKGP